MRKGISLEVSAADRGSPQKHVWRARIILASAEDCGTAEVMRRAGETTHWTSRAMAAATGLAVSTVQKIWRSHGLQPHRLRSFKLSRDPDFATKVRDVVGLRARPRAGEA